ncbi:unnamed protein product [Mytilus coruscus]|uniref:Uncharacterized protein n=1 Tax=Mytilus coruscus TaxID=42192 RepID=A0A6J8D168_MYTCO|nr:unnamed protein product [Mytilus coruscus]
MGKIREEKTQHTRQTSLKPEYSRLCRSSIHDRRSTAVLAKTCGKDLRKKDLKWLIENKLLSPHAKWVCKDCLLYANSRLEKSSLNVSSRSIEADIDEESTLNDQAAIPSEQPQLNEENCADEEQNFNPAIQKVLELIRDEKITKKEIDLLYFELGKNVSGQVFDGTLDHTYKNLDALLEISPASFLKSKPSCLVSFLYSSIAV